MELARIQQIKIQEDTGTLHSWVIFNSISAAKGTLLG
jgi:hypothetical protein